MSTPAPKFRRDYRPSTHVIDRVELDVTLDPQRTRVRARLAVRRNPVASPGAVERLTFDAEALELVSVAVDGVPVPADGYRLDDTGLTLHHPGDTFVLETEVVIDPQHNTALSGLYRSNGLYCTQCEAEGFRRITPFLDRPDIMAVYTTKITADAATCPVLLSNGDRVDAGSLDDGRHFATWHDPAPKPSYLFALVAGDLRCHRGQHVTASGKPVALEIWVEPVNLDRCEYALASLQRAMVWDEQVFGLEYDLSTYMIVAVSDFNMGAMENKGLNVFNAKYVLADRETATDEDCEGIESVVGHEYFHNWTGNRVTCRDWFQLTLKEGLTVFRDQWFSSDMRSAGVKRISEVKVLRTAQFAEDAGPMRHPIRPESYIEMNNFYTVTVYNKGAEVIGMLRTLLGREGFLAGMRMYFDRHDGQAVTCDDFLAAMADANDVVLDRFARWYARAGTPIVVAGGRYDAKQQTYELALEQRDPDGDVPSEDRCLHIPIAMGLLDDQGHDLPLRLAADSGPAAPTTRVLELTSARQTFCFVDIKSPPVPSLLRDFSAPIRLRLDRSRDELAFLMRHDSDAFNRWDAGEQLATMAILDATAAAREQRPVTLCPAFAAGFTGLLAAPEGDESWLALALTLPDERVVGQAMDTVDVEALHTAWIATMRELGRLHADTWRRIYDERCGDAYDDDAVAIGRRALKNVALAYLVATEDADAIALAADQFRGATNMTDAKAALGCLADVDDPESHAVVAQFYERWRDVPLVVDKWFAAQAAANRPDIVERVRTLTEHEAFTLTNPNRVRSLVGTFSQRNQAGFHRRDGAGYQLLTDTIVAIDSDNPQLASRLMSPLTQAHRFDEGRREAMRAALRRVIDREGVSRDVYEIAARSLGLVDGGGE